jgi:hypothetical protein
VDEYQVSDSSSEGTAMMDNNPMNYRRSPGDSFMAFLAFIGLFTLIGFGIFIGLLLAPYVG